MLFNSFTYLLFLPLVVVLHFALPHRSRWILLLAASYVFYMSWNPTYLLLILASTIVSYVAAIGIGRVDSARARFHLVTACLCANLGLLFAFKYWNFFNDSAGVLVGWFGLEWRVPDLDVLLPIGISFYTFQTLGYVIDVYRREVPPERHLGRFALYVAFFPQLVAGPIERARNLMPQITALHRFDWERICLGLQLILWGLFKKVVIADRLAIYVDTVYDNPAAHDPSSFLIATYAFAFQIYCDFSGYSDIAIGSASLLGFRLMKNFETPYFATSITDFWRRWHISLSTWLRDYLYIPLGGNRRGVNRTYANLLITMLLGGLWHGASWNFVIWGAIHGGLLALSRRTLPFRDRLYGLTGLPNWVRDGVRVVITFHLVCFAWIFFRAATLADSMTIVRGFFSQWGAPLVDYSVFSHGLIGLVLLLAVQLHQARRGSVRQAVAGLPTPVRWLGWYALIGGIVLLGLDGGSQFIYFQF